MGVRTRPFPVLTRHPVRVGTRQPRPIRWVPGTRQQAGAMLVLPLAAIVGTADAAFTCGLSAWRFSAARKRLASRQLWLLLVVAAATIPLLLAEIHFAWEAAALSTTGEEELTLAAVTGAGRMLPGLAWPMLLLVSWTRGVDWKPRLAPGVRNGLWFTLLGAMYAFTVYLKGFLSVLDGLLLLVLFAAFLWSIRGQRPSDTPSGWATRRLKPVAPVPPRKFRFETILSPAIAATILSGLFVGALVLWAPTRGPAPYGLVQWLVALVSNSPLLVVVAVLAWRARPGRAAQVLVSIQIVHLTLVLASLPMAFALHGLILGDVDILVLGGRQGSELLALAAQSTFAVIVLVGKMGPARSGLALLLLFAFQATLAALGYDGLLAAVVYLGAATAAMARDRLRVPMPPDSVPRGERDPYRPTDALNGAEPSQPPLLSQKLPQVR